VDALTAWFLLLLPMWTGTLKAMIRYQSSNVGLLSEQRRWNDLGRSRCCARVL